MKQFDFGQNWSEFSSFALDADRVAQARQHFAELVAHSGSSLVGGSFVDIGFGQGLSLLSAAAAGARVLGCDINPKCGETLRRNRIHFPELAANEVPIVIGSILDPTVVAALRERSPGGDGFQIVHSWGVLHHTGDMRTAIRYAAGLTRPGGNFVVAIYNRHWSSGPWLVIKWFYVHSPTFVQRLLIGLLSPVIFVAKWMVTGNDPRRQSRGMAFHYNVVDWVGGYPYEYSSIDEVRALIEPLGFELLHTVSAEVPTGCNEFVFRKRLENAA